MESLGTVFEITRVESLSGPILFFARWLHGSLTLWTGMLVPYPNIIAAAVQAQPSHLAPVRWRHVGNDAANYNVLNGLAVGTGHGRYLLTKETASLINFSFIPTILTTIFQFPSHR